MWLLRYFLLALVALGSFVYVEAKLPVTSRLASFFLNSRKSSYKGYHHPSSSRSSRTSHHQPSYHKYHPPSSLSAFHTPTSSRSAPSFGNHHPSSSRLAPSFGNHHQPSYHKYNPPSSPSAFHTPTSSRSAPSFGNHHPSSSPSASSFGNHHPSSSRSASSYGIHHPPSYHKYHHPTPSPSAFHIPTSSRSAPRSKITYRNKPSKSDSKLPELSVPEFSLPEVSRGAVAPPVAPFQIPTSSRSAPLSREAVLSKKLPSQRGVDGYETFSAFPGSRYKLYSHRVPWNEALLYCQKDGEGALLAVVNYRVEADIAKEMFARLQDNGTQYLHVGVNDIHQEGVWMAVMTGLDQPLSKVGYEVWKPGQPDNAEGENCGAVDREAKLHDVLCNMFGAPFLCEKPNL